MSCYVNSVSQSVLATTVSDFTSVLVTVHPATAVFITLYISPWSSQSTTILSGALY